MCSSSMEDATDDDLDLFAAVSVKWSNKDMVFLGKSAKATDLDF